MMNGYGNGYGGSGSYGDMMGGGWLGGLVFLFFGALIFAGVVMLVLWAVRASHGHGAAGVPGAMHRPAGAVGHDEAIAIAKRRLASGEIDGSQYDEIMRSLDR